MGTSPTFSDRKGKSKLRYTVDTEYTVSKKFESRVIFKICTSDVLVPVTQSKESRGHIFIEHYLIWHCFYTSNISEIEIFV